LPGDLFTTHFCSVYNFTLFKFFKRHVNVDFINTVKCIALALNFNYKTDIINSIQFLSHNVDVTVLTNYCSVRTKINKKFKS
jgi:hypothetical protein